jgi:nucleoside 2-deoxyribosyltransferase
MRVYLAGPPFAEEYRRRAADLIRRAGWEPVDPMRRDFRGRTSGHEAEIVRGDLADIDACDAVLAAFAHPDEGTAMEAWYAHGAGKPVDARSGDEDNRQRRAVGVAELAADLVPAHPRDVHVEDDEARPLRQRLLERVLAARGLGGQVSDAGEKDADKLAEHRVVVDDQNRAAVGFQSHSPPGSPRSIRFSTGHVNDRS